jgi:hypothetical protein
MSPREEWMCGPHRFWMEAPDLLCMEMHGALDVPSADAYLQLLDVLRDRFDTFSLLADLRDLGTIGSEARSTLARVDRPYPFRACALYGASFTMTIMATMLVKAARSLSKAPFTSDLAFFRTERQAREYLAPFREPPLGAP